LGSGIRDPGSGKNLFRIPDPGVKKHPIPDSGSRIRIRNTAIMLRKGLKQLSEVLQKVICYPLDFIKSIKNNFLMTMKIFFL
jgi:hypothetical protein